MLWPAAWEGSPDGTAPRGAPPVEGKLTDSPTRKSDKITHRLDFPRPTGFGTPEVNFLKAYVAWVTFLFCLLLCLCCGQSAAVAQRAPAQRTVPVVVADAQTEPAQPVPTVRISLGYLDGSVLVTEARDVTNPKGQAWLEVSEDAAQRGGLRIQVDGASNLVIYQPADGQLSALPATINVTMLPKGSPALLGPAQIQAMLHRMSLQISTLQKKNVALAGQENSGQANSGQAKSAQVNTERPGAAQAQKPDLGAALAEWAQSNGFSAGQADQQVQKWAEDIQKQSGGGNGGAKGAGGTCAQSLRQRRSTI